MKKLLKFVGLSREKEVVPEVPDVPDVPDVPETTCFVLSQDNKLVYIGDYDKGIVQRATTYVKKAKKDCFSLLQWTSTCSLSIRSLTSKDLSTSIKGSIRNIK